MGGASCSSYCIVSVQAVSCCASLPRDHARRLAGVDRHHSDNTDHLLPSVHHNHRASSVGSCACSAPTTTSPPGTFMHAHHGHLRPHNIYCLLSEVLDRCALRPTHYRKFCIDPFPDRHRNSTDMDLYCKIQNPARLVF